jgi:hypothetical protein
MNLIIDQNETFHSISVPFQNKCLNINYFIDDRNYWHVIENMDDDKHLEFWSQNK